MRGSSRADDGGIEVGQYPDGLVGGGSDITLYFNIKVEALVPCPPSPIPHLPILHLEMPERRFFFHF